MGWWHHHCFRKYPDGLYTWKRKGVVFIYPLWDPVFPAHQQYVYMQQHRYDTEMQQHILNTLTVLMHLYSKAPKIQTKPVWSKIELSPESCDACNCFTANFPARVSAKTKEERKSVWWCINWLAQSVKTVLLQDEMRGVGKVNPSRMATGEMNKQTKTDISHPIETRTETLSNIMPCLQWT